MPIHVAIDDQILWAMLYSLPFEGSRSPRSVEFVNLPDRSARLMTDVAYEGTDRRANRKIVISGDGPEMSRTVVQTLRSPAVGETPTIVLEGAGADGAMVALKLSDRWVFGAGASRTGSDDAGSATILIGDGIEPVDDVTEVLRVWPP